MSDYYSCFFLEFQILRIFTIVGKYVNKLKLMPIKSCRYYASTFEIYIHMTHACFRCYTPLFRGRMAITRHELWLKPKNISKKKYIKTEHIYLMPKTLSINIIDSELKARVINWHVMGAVDVNGNIYGKGKGKRNG